MKTPRFEELAARWRGQARVFIVFSREAHPHADGAEEIGKMADHVASRDLDGDGLVTREELPAPELMWEVMDLDRDGKIRAPELLTARRVEEFREFAAPRSLDERIAVARKYRAEVPGTIPVLVDTIDDATASVYGGAPNSAFVIGTDRRIAAAMDWADAAAIDAALAGLTGVQHEARPEPTPDLAPIRESLARAQADGRNVLVQFTAPGCGACVTMRTTTLADAAVTASIARYELAHLDLKEDAAWRLFDGLGLSGTPGFVVIDPSSTVRERIEGVQSTHEFLAFLARHAGTPSAPSR